MSHIATWTDVAAGRELPAATSCQETSPTTSFSLLCPLFHFLRPVSLLVYMFLFFYLVLIPSPSPLNHCIIHQYLQSDSHILPLCLSLSVSASSAHLSLGCSFFSPHTVWFGLCFTRIHGSRRLRTKNYNKYCMYLGKCKMQVSLLRNERKIRGA